MIQPPRILVAGGSRLPQECFAFATELGRSLMVDTGYVLVTGGLKRREPDTVATDFVVATAASAAVEQTSESPKSRIVTVLPETDVPTFERFRFGTVLEVGHSNVNARRFSMALTSNALVTIHGDKGTGEIIDLAFAAGKTLPYGTTQSLRVQLEETVPEATPSNSTGNL
ncbi:hypothetical protein ACFL5Q_04145 [Planctomycetota bacterium]